MQNYNRYGWISYNSEENCRAALTYLDNHSLPKSKFQIAATKSNTNPKPIKITPALVDDCFERDLNLVKTLISDVLDPEKKIDFAY